MHLGSRTVRRLLGSRARAETPMPTSSGAQARELAREEA
jgi:hypothetical protein